MKRPVSNLPISDQISRGPPKSRDFTKICGQSRVTLDYQINEILDLRAAAQLTVSRSFAVEVSVHLVDRL